MIKDNEVMFISTYNNQVNGCYMIKNDKGCSIKETDEEYNLIFNDYKYIIKELNKGKVLQVFSDYNGYFYVDLGNYDESDEMSTNCFMVEFAAKSSTLLLALEELDNKLKLNDNKVLKRAYKKYGQIVYEYKE